MEHKIIRYLLSFILSFYCIFCFGQSTIGTTGLLFMPTADMQKDKTFLFGGNYLDTKRLSTHFHSKEVNYTYNYYINITFFPWLEIGYTCTLVHADHGSTYFPQKVWGKFPNQDRAFNGKIRLWKEGWWKWWTPQIVLGADDPGSHESYGGGEIIAGNTNSSNNYATRLYLAASKHFIFKSIGELGTHLTYIHGKARGIPEYKDLAVGMNFRFNIKGEELYKKIINGLNIMAEYDARDTNLGFNYAIWEDRINVLCAWNECKYFSGGLQFKINLK